MVGISKDISLGAATTVLVRSRSRLITLGVSSTLTLEEVPKPKSSTIGLCDDDDLVVVVVVVVVVDLGAKAEKSRTKESAYY